MTAQLRQVGRSVTDLDRAVAFYGDQVGLDLIARFGDQLAFFDLDGVRLLLETDPQASADSTAIYLAVDDIDAAHAELVERGVDFDQAPHLIFTDAAGQFGPPGEEEWMAFFQDPDGNVVSISSRRPPQ